MKKLIFEIVVYIDEEDVKEFYGLDDDEVINFTDDDYYLTAWDYIERDECEYVHVSTENFNNKSV